MESTGRVGPVLVTGGEADSVDDVEQQGLKPRMSVAGCPSVRAVLGQDWWPGKFIYKGGTYVDKAGVEQKMLYALCPKCGKWVPVHDGDMIWHTPPAGASPKADMDRLQKMVDAKEAYGRVAARAVLDESASAIA